MVKNNRKYDFPSLLIDFLIIIVLLIISGSIIFNNIGGSTLYDWDESRHAQNALELLETGDLIVIKYAGQADLWNTKPPLGAWLISLSFRLFGTTEFAVRFFSAIAGMGSIALVYLLGKNAKNQLVGAFSALLLLINKGFIGFHGARTGDYDVLLTFFMLSCIYFFYRYTKKQKAYLLMLSALSLSFSILVKGVAGMITLLVIGIYVYFGKIKKIHMKDVFYSLSVFFVMILPWFALRFIRGKEFFINMITYDIFRRAIEPIEGHSGDLLYYFIHLNENLGILLFLLFIASLINSVYSMTRPKNKTGIKSMLTLWILISLLIFTAIKSKLFWYLIPIYPAISIITACTVDDIRQLLSINKILFWASLFVLLVPSLIDIHEFTGVSRIDPIDEAIRSLEHDVKGMDIIFLYSEDQDQSSFFYLSSYTAGKVHIIDSADDIYSIYPGHHVITYDKKIYDLLSFRNDFTLIKLQDDRVAIFEKT